MQENRKDNEQRGGQEGAGRLNDEARQDQGASGNAGGRDISEVDQQEGDMNNGTLGGNFEQDPGTTGSEQRS
ncbi:MAG TPA: hypothetical protein VGB46_07885 [Flavisolibacter sp.]|jgi:hypothetical protein